MIIILVSILVWGWLNQNWLAAGILFLLIVSSLVSSWRWAPKVKQFFRIGDFVTVLFVVALLFFSLVHTEQKPVFIILEWLPVFFLPILLVQLYSVNNQIPIGTLFYSVRKRQKISFLDFKYPYATICLLGAGAAHDSTLTYFVLGITVFSAMLWSVHSKNSSKILWFIVIFLAVVLSFWGQKSLRQLHTLVEEKSVEWLSDWQTDPFKSMTSIGNIGALKLSNKIEFRVKAEQPLLLLQSSYDRYIGQSWFASQRVFSAQSNYSNAKKDNDIKQLEVFQSLNRTTILALPSGTTAITGLEGGRLQFTPLGAVKLTEAPDFVNYKVAYTGKNVAKVHDFDLQIPPPHLPWIAKIKQELKLEDQPPAVIALSIKRYFQQNYHYTLFLGNESDADKALEVFMLKRKAGHCEYFAVASTLLLRSYGIPARLANGYSMQEYSELQQMYIVRRRHAHAWSIAFVDGVWQEVDSTPQQWLDMEEDQADLWQPVYDFFSSLYFNYKQWRYQQLLAGDQNEKNLTWLKITAILFVVLVWRLSISRKYFIKLQARQNEQEDYFDSPGKDSEFYLIERALVETEWARMANEPVISWVQRINNNELLEIGQMHYQYRFDNGHFSVEDRNKLKHAVQQWMDKFQG